MEPGEDIYEASKREVLEETGLHFDPSTLLVIESAGEHWDWQVKWIFLKVNWISKYFSHHPTQMVEIWPERSI